MTYTHRMALQSASKEGSPALLCDTPTRLFGKEASTVQGSSGLAHLWRGVCTLNGGDTDGEGRSVHMDGSRGRGMRKFPGLMGIVLTARTLHRCAQAKLCKKFSVSFTFSLLQACQSHSPQRVSLWLSKNTM